MKQQILGPPFPPVLCCPERPSPGDSSLRRSGGFLFLKFLLGRVTQSSFETTVEFPFSFPFPCSGVPGISRGFFSLADPPLFPLYCRICFLFKVLLLEGVALFPLYGTSVRPPSIPRMFPITALPASMSPFAVPNLRSRV